MGSQATTSAAQDISAGLERALIGASVQMKQTRSLVAQVGPSEASVLILGESGTGKEVVARGIHAASLRRNGPFVPVNCGAIPADLLESELFGHEKGAFTGAISARRGRFEMAAGGTLFLDEIGDMPLAMQVKLLRVLQERSFERVGSNATQQADVRVIAATHQDLEQCVDEGRFRMDLFYRLNVFPIEVPPLRQRAEDIPALVKCFVQIMQREKRGSVSIGAQAMGHLMAYPWPGNVRELSNLVERMAILHPGAEVGVVDLPEKFRAATATLPVVPEIESRDPSSYITETLHFASDEEDEAAVDPAEQAERELLASSGAVALPDLNGSEFDLKSHLADMERALMLQALEQSEWVVAKAAKLLNLQRTTLVEKMRKYAIARPEDATDI